MPQPAGVVAEMLRTIVYCASLVAVTVLVCRRDLVPEALRGKLPDSLEPYEPATERTRQLFILALIGGAAGVSGSLLRAALICSGVGGRTSRGERGVVAEPCSTSLIFVQ